MKNLIIRNSSLITLIIYRLDNLKLEFNLIVIAMVSLFSNVTATRRVSGPTTILFSAVTTTGTPKMIGALTARAWERPTTASPVNHTTAVAVQSNPDTALYSRAAKEHVMLRIITSQEIRVRYEFNQEYF